MPGSKGTRGRSSGQLATINPNDTYHQDARACWSRLNERDEATVGARRPSPGATSSRADTGCFLHPS